jgi:hypothetical protein
MVQALTDRKAAITSITVCRASPNPRHLSSRASGVAFGGDAMLDNQVVPSFRTDHIL